MPPAGTRFDALVELFLAAASVLVPPHLRARYGNLAIALAAYNWGPTRISEMLRRSQPIPVGYSQRVLDACRGPAVAVGRPA